MVSLFAEHLPAPRHEEIPKEARPWLRWALGDLP